MSIATVAENTWTSILTTTGETVFQNRSINAMYITTEPTGSLEVDQGFYLAPQQAIVLGAGLAVSAITFRNDGELFYMLVV